MRTKLIEIIENYASDELTTKDWIDIAKESDEELLDRVANILDYYCHEYQSMQYERLSNNTLDSRDSIYLLPYNNKIP